MTPTAVRRSFLRLASGFLVVAALGCGLGDYEEKMTREQKYDKLASGPLELPNKKLPLDVFVLPPRGVNVRPEPEAKRYQDRFYQYKGGSDFSNVYLGWAKDDKEDFRAKVVSAFPGKVKTGLKTTTQLWDPRILDNPDYSLDLDTVTIEEKTRIFYVYLTPGNKAALVYEVSKQGRTSPEALQVSREVSLNTLALGDAAAQARAEFKKLPQPRLQRPPPKK